MWHIPRLYALTFCVTSPQARAEYTSTSPKVQLDSTLPYPYYLIVTELVLEVKKLLKDYGEYRAVDHISFTIKRGQVMGLLGPNGAGKSTTIQMLAAVTIPTAGSIRYFGKDLVKHRQACLQRINYASAYNTLQNHITAKENLLVFAALYGIKKPKEKIAELLDYFGLGRQINERYGHLSAGERTRVNLVKALLNDPELILMDEPTASLDPDIADKTLSLIEALRRDRQLSILFTSHNMREVSRICDEVIFLDHGKVVSIDTPANHAKQLDHARVVLQYNNAAQAHLEKVLRAQGVEFTFDEPERATIRLASGAVVKLIAALHNAHIPLQDIDITKSTLEDVFLHIARRNK